MNHCKLFLLFLLFLFTIINVTIGSVPELSPNTFLFCLKPELEPLEISLNRGRLSVGLPELDDFFQSPGFHSVVWEASSYPSGLYFIRMVSNNITDTRKILLIK